MAESEGLAELRKLISKYLDEIGFKYLRDQNDNYVIPFGEGVRIHLVPKEFGDHTAVQVLAPTNVGVPVSGDLAMFIATENAKLVFGRLALYAEQGAVGFEESLLGNFLNRAELEVAIAVCAASANKYDDEIMQRFGGQKAGTGF